MDKPKCPTLMQILSSDLHNFYWLLGLALVGFYCVFVTLKGGKVSWPFFGVFTFIAILIVVVNTARISSLFENSIVVSGQITDIKTLKGGKALYYSFGREGKQISGKTSVWASGEWEVGDTVTIAFLEDNPSRSDIFEKYS